ncbi:MAG TPA: diguanylate cyclase [Planctomycetota bacterium]|nr:diguanylate cyclase [Planctomycetota bacterium]
MQILIVEREEGSARQVEEDLRGSGFDGVRRCGANRAVIETTRVRPDLVLIEFDDASAGGAQLCHTLKRAIEPEFVPVLMLTGEKPASVVLGFEAGADDCIHWPYDLSEMLARVRSMLRIKNLHDELRVVNARLTELSVRDGLTGLYNRRYLFERLAAEVERAVRYQQWLGCIMIDMDAFKPVNDDYGHLVGDELFRRAAKIFRSIPRTVDIVARYGGDEVAVLLPASGIEAASSVAHRLCDTMAHEVFRVGERDIGMTVSVGVACLDPRNPISADELVHRADLALYASKHAGGNRVTVWQPGMTAGN